MDVWIFSGLLLFCLLLIIIGLYKYRLLVSLAGIFILLLAFTLQTEGLTIKAVANETSSFIYGNQTSHLQILNESEVSTGFPHTFTTTYYPLVGGSNVCYFTLNGTSLSSTILYATNGTINITG